MKAWVAEEHAPSASGLPTSAMFSDGNGGEYRKSYHGFAPGYAIVVDSPTELQISPMQASAPIAACSGPRMCLSD